MIAKLNKNQFDYLKYSLSKEEISKLKLIHVDNENQFVSIEVDEDIADRIRDWASDELQKKGFDINYELNYDGKLLEELIDIFYVQ
ncbi:hypothetical protein [Bacteroides sp. UBA939]|uniref:hypothetical protein n=1 Tax=Bacteroides sp. UBA939 TaxID=1946092 RepID=UPI0025BEA3A2|nr:hypothetical protein [Bacteroides sp. UBA939]